MYTSLVALFSRTDCIYKHNNVEKNFDDEVVKTVSEGLVGMVQSLLIPVNKEGTCIGILPFWLAGLGIGAIEPMIAKI